MDTPKQKNRALTAGVILGIISNVIFIGFFIAAIILLIRLVNLKLWFTGDIILADMSPNTTITLSFIFMIGPIVTLVFTVRFLKGKFDNKKTVGVLNLVFAILTGIIIVGIEEEFCTAVGLIAGLMGLTAGILILVKTKQKNND